LDLSRIVLSAQRSRTSAANAPTASEDPTVSYERLMRTADVLVENFAPSSSQQAIVPFAWLSGLNPRPDSLLHHRYGQFGPLKDEPPIDDLVMAQMGILGSQPGFRPPPVHVVHPLPSVGAAILAAQGITAGSWPERKQVWAAR